jgi:glycosyltransferase involved in cell wall biosynthesis
LAAVEAAACGKAVVTTGWGAAGEIFDEESAYVVEYELIDAGGIAYDWAIGGHAGKEEDCQPRMARPTVKSLAAAMRRAYEDGEGREKRASAALARAQEMTWAKTARGILESLG